jgi:protein involved in polysaccharide export with SLBB domain
MTVAGLLPDAGAFLPETYFEYALLTRLVPPDLHKEVIPLNLREIVLERKPGADVALKPRDSIRVFPRSDFRDLPLATISGEVRKPGTYEVLPGTLVSDLVKRSGDLTRDTYLEEAELSRLTEDRQNTVIVKINLRLALAGDASQNLVIRDRDHLMIRPMPDIRETRYVTLKGEVRSPGVYAARKGERLSSLIQRAGGFTQDAYLRGAQFTRVSTQKSQQEAIDKLIEELELEVAQKAQQVSGAIDKEDVEASKELWAARRALIAQLKKTKAKGRVIIRLADGNIAGTPFDLMLEDGDALDVPKKMSVVNVVGRVYNPTGVVYNPAKDTVGYNLDMVGGPTASADTEQIFVLRVDGSVFSRDNTGGMFSGGLLSAKVEPGDTIMVPEKLIQVRVMKDVKDITQILMQIAVTAGVLIALF